MCQNLRYAPDLFRGMTVRVGAFNRLKIFVFDLKANGTCSVLSNFIALRLTITLRTTIAMIVKITNAHLRVWSQSRRNATCQVNIFCAFLLFFRNLTEIGKRDAFPNPNYWALSTPYLRDKEIGVADLIIRQHVPIKGSRSNQSRFDSFRRKLKRSLKQNMTE